MLVWRREPIRFGELADETVDEPGIDWRPDLDVYETPEEFLLVLCLPGIAPDGIDLTVLGSTLTISGHRRVQLPPEARPMLLESPRGRFLRRIRVPVRCDMEGIGTRLADGQLVIRVPKGTAAVPVHVPVAVSGDRR
jgi:HSP20 family protein